MSQTDIRSNLLLLLAAAIWGFAFVAQRLGMEHVGPFTFNAIRFALGALAMAGLLLCQGRFLPSSLPSASPASRRLAIGCLLLGLVLFVAASLQQFGMVYTTAGKAGFITGLYVIIVPLLGLLWGQRTSIGHWTGAMLAVTGMYLLSVTEALTIERGDFLVLLGAFLWAVHVLLVGWLSPQISAIKLALMQFSICSALSLCAALLTEEIVWQRIQLALVPILYAGLLSVGVAYTLQIVAQKRAKPAHAAILLSLEAVFAVLGGWIVLSESMAARGLVGCALMLTGMVVAQLVPGRGGKRRPELSSSR